jgi:hypothetical protein
VNPTVLLRGTSELGLLQNRNKKRIDLKVEKQLGGVIPLKREILRRGQKGSNLPQ